MHYKTDHRVFTCRKCKTNELFLCINANLDLCTGQTVLSSTQVASPLSCCITCLIEWPAVLRVLMKPWNPWKCLNLNPLFHGLGSTFYLSISWKTFSVITHIITLLALPWYVWTCFCCSHDTAYQLFSLRFTNKLFLSCSIVCLKVPTIGLEIYVYNLENPRKGLEFGVCLFCVNRGFQWQIGGKEAQKVVK